MLSPEPESPRLPGHRRNSLYALEKCENAGGLPSRRSPLTRVWVVSAADPFSSPSRTRTYNKPVNSRKDVGRKSMEDSTSGHDKPQLSAPLAQPPADPDLSRVIEAWPILPAHIRAAVLALVQTAR